MQETKFQNSNKIKRFIECYLPVTTCNLRCHYCYIIQQSRRKNICPKFKYSSDHIRKALSKERLGGECYISICGGGETLIPKELPTVVEQILQEGHKVNITTNGTLTKRIKEFMKMDKNLLKNLHFSFSFHYLELVDKKLLDVFFNNVNLVKENGCSFIVQLNLCDEYETYLEEIKEVCLKNTGALPQLALTRQELKNDVGYDVYSQKTKQNYKKMGDSFESNLWDFTNKYFLEKRKEFCYAGEWAFILDIVTGEMKQCYCEDNLGNIYKKINKPISFKPVGYGCKSTYCVNSSHFLSLGCIPELNKDITYEKLRNRTTKDNNEWFNETMKNFLSSKLKESNIEYTEEQKKNANKYSKQTITLKNIASKLKRIYRTLRSR